MKRRSGTQVALGVAAALGALVLVPAAQAQDFFSALFGGFGGGTCNGKDQIGLAPIRIENDPTLRKGDIVAGADGLMVAGRGADKRGASLNFSPASHQIRSRYQRVPVVARE